MPVRSVYQRVGKRIFDLVLATLGGIVLLPVAAITAIAIRVEDGGPALYRQSRIGVNGDEFMFVKFRSMPVDTPDVESAHAAELDVTRVGRVIRRTSIDELPQLINVIRGDMSLVGPRPPIPTQKQLIEDRRAAGVLHLRPGMTGLAQIHGYDGMPDIEKVAWDKEYAESVSLRRDVGILFLTIRYLVKPPPRY